MELRPVAGSPGRRHRLRGPHGGRFRRRRGAAWANPTALSLIHVHLAEDDFSQPLERFAERLRSRVADEVTNLGLPRGRPRSVSYLRTAT